MGFLLLYDAKKAGKINCPGGKLNFPAGLVKYA